jgi:adenine-specific DNA-methyltransferase
MTKKIDYDKWSKEELVKEIVKIKSTIYGLVWHRDLPEEKIDILINPDARTPNEMFPNEMGGKPFPVLKEVKGKAIESDKSKLVNLLIEGDNYHSLAVLNFTHREAVDLIYIDPPYNTGNNDFIYNDKYVDVEDSFRHSKWLSFMEKRLKLAKNLLKNDGVIFISIDDNEQAPLKMLCDEIFGPENFIGMITVQSTPGGRQSSKSLAVMGDYVLVYGKSQNSHILGLPLSQKRIEQYAKQDKNGKYLTERLRQHGIAEKREDVPTLYFPIFYNEAENKISTIKKNGYDIEILPILPNGGDGRWIWSKQKMDKDKDFIEIRKVKRNGGYVYDAFFKKYLVDSLREKLPTIWIESDLRTEVGSKELREIFGGEKVFDFPKPTYFIKRLIQSCTNSNEIILDFMAGSGTTGQAVLELNKEDGGSRSFILCTNNGDEKSKHRIASDICYPRVKKVITGYKNSKREKITGLGGNLKYFVTDFVEAEPTDKNKRKLVKESTDMLCILENAFELIQETPEFKIFKNTDKYVGVIFYEEAIEDYKKAIKKINGHFNTYVFSMGDDPHTKKFADVKSKVTLCAIPEIILKVYREIFK